MELYIVRHGETYSNIGKDKTSDSLLTDKGLEQADYLGKRLSNIKFDKIYASHLNRAIQTAATIAKYQDDKPMITVVSEFCERGISPELEANKELHKTIYDNICYMNTSLPRGYGGDIERTQEALNKYVFHSAYENTAVTTECGNDIIKKNPEKVLIVAHGGINAVILSCLVGFRFDINMNIVQRNTCINSFELFLHNGIPRIKFLSYNDVSHLPEDLITG